MGYFSLVAFALSLSNPLGICFGLMNRMGLLSKICKEVLVDCEIGEMDLEEKNLHKKDLG